VRVEAERRMKEMERRERRDSDVGRSGVADPSPTLLNARTFLILVIVQSRMSTCQLAYRLTARLCSVLTKAAQR
jgi:hypothetical protein